MNASSLDHHHHPHSADEGDTTALRRLFAAAVDGADRVDPPPPPPMSLDDHSSQQEEDESVGEEEVDAPPQSWPRTHSRKSSLTHPIGRLRTPSLSPARPLSAAAEAREQLHLLQQHQQLPDGHPRARFFRAKTLELGGQQRYQQWQADEAEADPQDEVTMLREQVMLLLKNLEDEKKRRMHEHKLMQEKIMELQGLIRRNLPEQQKAQERRLVQMRSPSAVRTKARGGSKHQAILRGGGGGPLGGRKSSKSSDELSALVRKASAAKCESDELAALTQPQPSSKSSDDVGGASSDLDDDSPTSLDLDDVKQATVATDKETVSSGCEPEAPLQVEARLKKQLTKLRVRMQTAVADAQGETQTLRSLLKSERQNHERRERQVRVETNAKLFALEERHASAKKRMTAKVTLLSAQLNQLQTENQMLAVELSEKDARIAHLELAVGGTRSSQGGSVELTPPSAVSMAKQP